MAEFLERGRRAALERYAGRRHEWVEELKRLVRIPSVSFGGFPPREVERSAEQVRALLIEAGLENVRLMRIPDTHPYVYGEWLGRPGAPTVLLYAHHDVQPPMREERWMTPVFDAVEKDGRLYGRGTADDKAGILIHAASIRSWLDAFGSLPVNVKVLIEGEEETGSLHLADFLERHRDVLRADLMVLTDCTNFDTGLPSLTTSLRGLVSLEVTVTALDHPLHSGMWGGPIPDPVMGLSKILASLVDEDGRLAVPELWEDVLAPTGSELEDIRKLGMDDATFRGQAGVVDSVRLFGKDHELLLKMWREPSLVVNSIQSGGRKIAGNVIMDAAWARVGLRLVPDMEHGRCARVLAEAIRSRCPWGLRVDVIPEQGANAWTTRPEHPVFKLAKRALQAGYGREAAFIGCGGTIPFVEHFTRALGDVPALLVGVEDPYTNAHSENESLDLEDFHKAVLSQIHFFAELGADRDLFGPAGTKST